MIRISSGRGSLVRRLVVWAFVLFAISLPIFWSIFAAAVSRVSQDVVDTRILEFGDQIRGFWASTAAAGSNQTTSNPILAGLDIEWIWQISVGDETFQSSPLLALNQSKLKPTITEPTPAFTLKTVDTTIGTIRLAERIVNEIPPAQDLRATARQTVRVHYMVGVAIDRYQDQVEQHAARLRNLAIIGAIPASLSLFGLLVIIIFAIRRNLDRAKTAMRRYESGETELIEGEFPSEIQNLIHAMNGLLRQNAKLIERTRKYVSKIAHDINHPLAIIKNSLAGETDKGLIGRQVDRMAGLVDRYSSLARAIGPEGQAGAQTRLAEMITDVAEGFSILYRRTPLAFEEDCPPELTVRIPRHDLEAMVSNLVSNAHKYAESRARISARLEKGDLVISVEDDGPGIPEEERAQALNWGQRLDEAPPGAGFGLSIVYDIADMYDGRVQLAQSDLGGLRAEIVLPMN